MPYDANEFGEIYPLGGPPAADRSDGTAAPPGDATASAPSDDAELRRRASLAEQRLYDRLADLQGALEDMRRERDAWREQAQRFPASPPPRTRWGWRRSTR